jgi:hypothetical protein
MHRCHHSSQVGIHQCSSQGTHQCLLSSQGTHLCHSQGTRQCPLSSQVAILGMLQCLLSSPADTHSNQCPHSIPREPTRNTQPSPSHLKSSLQQSPTQSDAPTATPEASTTPHLPRQMHELSKSLDTSTTSVSALTLPMR